MTTIAKAREDAMMALRAALPDAEAFEMPALETPPERAMGDLAFPCFALAKALKKAPNAIAQEIAGAIQPTGLIARAEAAGPYVNLYLDRAAFVTALLAEARAEHGLLGEPQPSGRKVLVEYAQPNTHKDLHVGHLRNFVLGAAVIRVLNAAGHNAVPISYINDAGAAVAKCLWAYKTFYDGKEPEGVEERGKFLGEVYADADRRITEDEALKADVGAVLQKLESGDPDTVELWKQTRQWSLDLFTHTFAELGAPIEKYYYESDIVEDGRKVIDVLLEKGIAKKSDGAIIVDLEEEGLGVLVIVKSDGTTLYATADLALAAKKFEDHPDATESVYVVDVRQSLYFKQLFRTFEMMGFDKPLVHLAYEFVTLKEGAMSSRKGTVVRYAAFRDEMRDHVEKETRARHRDWDDAKVTETAAMIADGAMKFTMLKSDNDKQIVFDIEEALSFDGFTGPYVQYAQTRLASILSKAEGSDSGAAKGSDDEAEYFALRLLADLPDVVGKAAAQYRPALLAHYLFDLAKASNDFYRDVKVLTAESADRKRRLAIVRALRTGLKQGLALLGISSPDRM